MAQQRKKVFLMLEKPMDVLSAYPVRKSKKQKQAFREDVQALVKAWGYESQVEQGAFGARNLIIGQPQTAQYLVTAHYDTCARLPFPNLITPTNFWLFLLYQLALVALLLAAPALPALPVYWLTQSWEAAHWVWYGLFWLGLILMLVGPANPSNANDNTSGVVTVLEIAKSLPPDCRSQVCFVLFDLEEAGLLGSASYRSKHKKQVKDQMVLNLDCVGDGDQLWLFPSGTLKKSPQDLAPLERLAGTYGTKTIHVPTGGFSVYPSDQANFPKGVGICALGQGRLAPYMSRIHTPRDTVLDETNVNLLRTALTGLITGAAQIGKEQET